MAGKHVVVTGVSSGIGFGIARVLIEKGYQVFGSVRKQSDAESLKTKFGEAFVPIIMDVTDEEAVSRAAEQVRSRIGFSNLAGLVNNAGMSLIGPLIHQPVADFRQQIEVNLISPFIVTKAFANLLGVDRSRQGKPGRIINISSAGGKVGPPFLGAYAASKHGLEGMSETLRRELQLYGIDVIIIGPGYVKTAILDKAEVQDLSVYNGTEYASIIKSFMQKFIAEGRKGLPPEHIGELVHKALTVKHPQVRYAVMQQKLINWTIPMLLPKRVVDRLIGKQLGLLQ